MAWPWLAVVASNIPWVELVRRTPEILDGSRRLLAKSRRLEPLAPANVPPAERQLHDRIATLEAREIEQARVVEQMAEQLHALTVSVEVLAARNRLLVYVVVVLAAAIFLVTVLFAR